MKKYYATKPFYWDGENIDTSKPVKMGEMDGRRMLARVAVTEAAPKKGAKKAK